MTNDTSAKAARVTMTLGELDLALCELQNHSESDAVYLGLQALREKLRESIAPDAEPGAPDPYAPILAWLMKQRTDLRQNDPDFFVKHDTFKAVGYFVRELRDAAPLPAKDAVGEAVINPMETCPKAPEAFICRAWVHEGCVIVIMGTNDKPVGWIDTHAWLKGQIYRDQLIAASSQPKDAQTGVHRLNHPVDWKAARAAEAKEAQSVAKEAQDAINKATGLPSRLLGKRREP